MRSLILSPAKASDPRRIHGFVSCNSPGFRIANSFTIIYMRILIPPRAWIEISSFFPVTHGPVPRTERGRRDGWKPRSSDVGPIMIRLAAV